MTATDARPAAAPSPASARPRYDAPALHQFAMALTARAGLGEAMGRAVTDVLIEGDLLGHDTHGLHLLAGYLRELGRGRSA